MSNSVSGQSTDEPGEQNGGGTIPAAEESLMPKQEPAVTPTLPEDHSLSSVVVSVVGPFLPKAERLPWPTFFRLTAWCMLPAAVYTALFTQMGLGEIFYFALSSGFGGYRYALAGALVVAGFFFYILDIDEWTTRKGKLFRAVWSGGMLGTFVILVMLVSNEYPFGLITLFAILNPLCLLLVKSLFYEGQDTRTFVSWLSGPLLFVSFLTAASFIVWAYISYDNQLNSVMRVEVAHRTGCEPNFADYPGCQNEYSDESGDTCFYIDYTVDRPELVFSEGCDQKCVNVFDQCANVFMLWVGPVLMSLSMLFLSFFCTFLRTEGSNEEEVFNFARIWIVLLGLIWASASLSGTAAGITSSLISLTLASLVASSIVLSASLSKEERKDSKEAILLRIQEKYGDSLDVVRALFIVTCGPIVLLYCCLSAINQLVRRTHLNPCSQPSIAANSCETNPGVVTVRTKKHLTKMRSWNISLVFTYAVYWGIAYVVMQIFVAKLTVVFLSWMIEKTATMGLAPVTLIMLGVGVIMFLLPPVPGVPVYFTLGIVLTAQGKDALGYTGSIFYSTAIGLILKLLASAMQQKLIGENLSRFVAIRQLVGINSILMKAMRLVLSKNGLDVAKVAVLIGGPDWPTSVLCGIMKLGLPQIILGTVPVVFLIFPTCLTGSLLYMAALDNDTGNPMFPWAGTASTLTASLTAFVQFGSMFTAAFYLERTADKRKVEVMAIEDDKEVKEKNEQDEQRQKCYANVTRWNALPIQSKSVLVGSLVCMTSCCYMVQFFSSMCFVEHTLTDSIGENLDGSVSNLFRPLGWTALALFGASCALLHVFCAWGNKQADKLMASGDGKTVPLTASEVEIA